jgi:hypothetical protein
MGAHYHIELNTAERRELKRLIHRGRAPARQQTRARILLLSDRSQGHTRTDHQVAEVVHCNPSTVGNVRRRYAEGGLPHALHDKGWPGPQPKLTGELEAKLTLLACSQPPPGHGRWTLRLLANQLVELGYVAAVSHVTVRQWLKKTNSSRGG